MTKFQFMGAMMCLMAVLFVGTVYNLSFAVRENQARIKEIAGNSARLGQLAERAEEDHAGLCAFIADLDQRVDANRKLLAENEGPLIFGIPRNVIEQSVNNQGSTLNALRPIDCTVLGP
jgi:hypothetical protein